MDLSRVSAARHGRLPWLLGQAVLLLIGVVVYFRVRGLTDAAEDVAEAHSRDIVAFEQATGIYVEASFQRPVEASRTLQTLANWIYIWGHWPVIIVTMLWLAWRHRPEFLRLRDGMVVSGGIGMLVFVTFPVAPPRLAGLGMSDTVTESSRAYRVLQPPAFVNQYAAMPSLHAGWDLLVGIAVFTAGTSLALRILGCTMPVLMSAAVVATANHYVVDVLAGVLLVLVGHVAALGLERHRLARGRAPA
jgi:hypothetical protein